MVCELCKGKGWVQGQAPNIPTACPACDGKGFIEQTNEEYLRSANVNDMARCIATKLLELARHEYGIYDVVDYATVFEWLKEKHE